MVLFCQQSIYRKPASTIIDFESALLLTLDTVRLMGIWIPPANLYFLPEPEARYPDLSSDKLGHIDNIVLLKLT